MDREFLETQLNLIVKCEDHLHITLNSLEKNKQKVINRLAWLNCRKRRSLINKGINRLEGKRIEIFFKYNFFY